MDDHVKIITLEDQVTQAVALDEITTLNGPQALGDLLETELSDGLPIASLLVDVDVEGGPTAIRWAVTTKTGGNIGKFDTARLFPRADSGETRCKVTSFSFDGASLDFSPDSWTSDWVEAKVLRVAFLKGPRGGASAGRFTTLEATVFGARDDFLVRASIELTDDIRTANLVFSGIPTGTASLDDLPGYVTPGINYPCVNLARWALNFVRP